MTIELPETMAARLRAVVASGLAPSVDEAIGTAVRQWLAGLPDPVEHGGTPGGGAAARAARQHETLTRLRRDLDALPATADGDGLTNRDHDRILYGP